MQSQALTGKARETLFKHSSQRMVATMVATFNLVES